MSGEANKANVWGVQRNLGNRGSDGHSCWNININRDTQPPFTSENHHNVKRKFSLLCPSFTAICCFCKNVVDCLLSLVISIELARQWIESINEMYLNVSDYRERLSR